jgi:hypothetical protein
MGSGLGGLISTSVNDVPGEAPAMTTTILTRAAVVLGGIVTAGLLGTAPAVAPAVLAGHGKPTVADAGWAGPTFVLAGHGKPTTADAGWAGPTIVLAGHGKPTTADAGWAGPTIVLAGHGKPTTADAGWAGPTLV